MEREKTESLIHQVCSGDRTAATAFFRQFGNAVRKAVVSVTPKGNAYTRDDLFMEACKHIMEKNWYILRQLKNPELLVPYLITVSRRWVLHVVQKEERKKSFPDQSIAFRVWAEESGDSTSSFTEEYHNAIRDATASLSNRDRLFIADAFSGDYPTDELCKRFGLCNANALYKKKNKIKNSIGKKMRQYLLIRQEHYG